MEENKKSLTVEEAAELLGVGVRTIINYLHSKRLAGNKVGKKWFINLDSFKELQGVQPEELEFPSTNSKPLEISTKDGPWKIKLSAFKRILECSKVLSEEKVLDSQILEKLSLNLEYSLEMMINGYFSFGQSKVIYYEKSKEGLSRGLAILYVELNELHPVSQAYLEAINATVALGKRIQNENKKRNKKSD